MNFVTYTSSLSDLKQCAEVKEISEVLIEPALLACEGRLSNADAIDLARQARSLGLKPVLVWDTLKTELQMAEIVEELSSWDLSLFDAVRVRDVGAAEWIVEASPLSKLHLIAETGNHNLLALKGWCDLFQGNLERILLSIELPEEKLIEYCNSLPVPCEVLGAGRIRLFYSPRKLLGSNFGNQDEIGDLLEVVSASEDSHGRSFPTVESVHGTFMFLDKDQFILDKMDGLKSAGLHSARIDLRHLSADGESCTGISSLCIQLKENSSAVRKEWPRPTLAPFFKTNKTTAQFGKLKSQLHIKRDNTCLAQVVATERGRFIAYFTLRNFDIDSSLVAVLPTGEEVALPKMQFKSVQGEAIDRCVESAVVTSKWVGKITPGTLIKHKEIIDENQAEAV